MLIRYLTTNFPAPKPGVGDSVNQSQFVTGWLPESRPHFATLNNGEDGLNTRPHPGLLPRGEGELFAASLECRATGLAGQSSASRKSCAGMSSPWGEEIGEGGR